MQHDTLRILSWNVNGLRAAARKGFLDWLGTSGADVVGVQEVRADPEQLSEELRAPEGWHACFSAAERPGYSGVGLYSRVAPDAVETRLGVPAFDAEGRVQIARFGDLALANVYFPNGSGKDRDNGRVPFKLEFYARLRQHLDALRAEGLHVLVMGDFNTAPTELDLANPKTNRKTSGFLVEECEALDLWLRDGWIDTFRRFEPDGGHYTWWSQRKGVRERNIGWRIDLVLAGAEAAPFVRRAFHQPHVLGSDHCPIGVEVDRAILAGAARAA